MNLDFTANLQYDDFRTQIMSVEELLYQCDKAEFRKALGKTRRTSIEQRSRIVEALLLGMPQQPLFIDDTEQKWIVIDGIGRMDAIYSFCRAGMLLTSLFFKMGNYEGRTFNSLSPFEKSKILNTKIVIHVLNSGLSPQERFGVYICLKSRIDSATLKWCRSRIYTEEYKLIENLAEEIKASLSGNFNKTEAIENRICHLIVGANYRQFINLKTNHHIDAVANSFLGSPDFRFQATVLFEDIKETLKVTCQLSPAVLPFQYQCLYDSVFYHIRHSASAGSLQEQFRQLLKEGYQVKGPKDSAENFCNKIDWMLKLI